MFSEITILKGTKRVTFLELEVVLVGVSPTKDFYSWLILIDYHMFGGGGKIHDQV